VALARVRGALAKGGHVIGGTVLAGKYRLIALLGRGGMGTVWKAERIGWQTPVAVKLMNIPDTHDPQSLARFKREAGLAASLRSVHVVQVLDDGLDPASGAPFIVMELLEGETLAERLSRVKRLRSQVVAQIITQIARGLARAHDAGLIHRDLKPDNILIVRNDDEELLKVLDFGIAKWLTPGSPSSGTLAGQMLGTPAYMSPEHFANSTRIDHRADLWSLGVIAFECMTGERPFQGDSLVSLALSVGSGRIPMASRLADVPDGFDAWFARAVAQDPAQRFPSARIMAEELRGLCGQMPMLWEPEALPPREHAPREKTEIEPVLELRRRARAGAAMAERFPNTEDGSVQPTLRTSRAPAGRRGWRWLSAALLLGALTGSVMALLPAYRPRALDTLAWRLRNAASALRGAGPPSAVNPGPFDPGLAAPAPPVASVGKPSPEASTGSLSQFQRAADAAAADAGPDAAAGVRAEAK
jgi:serine/threonine protein kinase